MSKSSSYREGWNDASSHFLKSYIEKVTVDKLLDQLNQHNKIFKYILNHFRKGKNISGKFITDDIANKDNLESILKLIELEKDFKLDNKEGTENNE